MSRPQKILTIALWLVAATAMVAVAAMKYAQRQNQVTAESVPAGVIWTKPNEPLPELYPAPDFSLTNQNNQPFTKTQLLGHPWVGDFIFTTCPDMCPIMSTRMSTLQAQLPAEVKLVSFTVDPKHDTPAILATYAQQYHAEDGRWFFLTGPEAIQESIVSGMKLHFKAAQGASPIEHSPDFVLVDAKGVIRSYYDSNVPGQIDLLTHDVQRLLSESGK
jgi:protein SCO1